MTDRELFIVEVDAFEGEAASISVTDAHGAPLRSGVVRALALVT